MATASTIARLLEQEAPAESARRCLATGEVRPKDKLIRFVIGPDRAIVPDLSHNLPGRGFWVVARREAIDRAVHKNLFAKAAKASVKTAPDLATQVEHLLIKRSLELLGLSRSAGLAVLGQPQVEAALKAKKLALLLIAEDAGSNGINKVSSETTETVRLFTRDQLGAALGHDQLVYVGLKPHGLTAKLLTELKRLEKIVDKPHISEGMDSENL